MKEGGATERQMLIAVIHLCCPTHQLVPSSKLSPCQVSGTPHATILSTMRVTIIVKKLNCLDRVGNELDVIFCCKLTKAKHPVSQRKKDGEIKLTPDVELHSTTI